MKFLYDQYDISDKWDVYFIINLCIVFFNMILISEEK